VIWQIPPDEAMRGNKKMGLSQKPSNVIPGLTRDPPASSMLGDCGAELDSAPQWRKGFCDRPHYEVFYLSPRVFTALS